MRLAPTYLISDNPHDDYQIADCENELKAALGRILLFLAFGWASLVSFWCRPSSDVPGTIGEVATSLRHCLGFPEQDSHDASLPGQHTKGNPSRRLRLRDHLQAVEERLDLALLEVMSHYAVTSEE